jgi:hypothetical protein
VPEGYTLISEPVPLLTAWDGRWIARARDGGGEGEGEGEGVLIYEDQRCCVFLVADEALSALAYLMQEGLHLVAHCYPELAGNHTQIIEHLRALWWLKETRKTKAMLLEREKGSQQEEGGPHS